MTPVEKLQEIALLRSKQVTSRVFLILLLLLAGVAVMWGLNISGLRAFNLIPFFLGFFYLLAVGASPVAIGASALTGSIIRAGNLSNPLAGIADGVKFWLTVALPAAILSFCALAGFLATWPFENNPISFWYVAAFSVVLATAAILYKKGGEALYGIVVTYSVVIIGISLASSFFDLDDANWFGGGSKAKTSQEVAAPIVEACDDKFKDVRGCKKLTISEGSCHFFTPPSRHCYVWDTASTEMPLVSMEHRGASNYALCAIAPQETVYFFPIPVGTSYLFPGKEGASVFDCK